MTEQKHDDARGASTSNAELERTRQLLAIALERMDRARNILTNGNPRTECNWGMLDTTDLRSNVEFSGGAPLHGAASAGTQG